MNKWFRFGQLHHLEVEADPQVAACGSRPINPQPTFEGDLDVPYMCRRCRLALINEMIEEEDIEDAISRGYEVVGPAD